VWFFLGVVAMQAEPLANALISAGVGFVASVTLRTKKDSNRDTLCVTTDKSAANTVVFRWHEIGYIGYVRPWMAACTRTCPPAAHWQEVSAKACLRIPLLTR
jgi:hypothetical protein